MRNFQDLDNYTQQRISELYEKNEVGFPDLEGLYDVDPRTFRDYLIEKVKDKYEKFRPTPPKPKYEWTQPYKKLGVQMLISGLLLASTFALSLLLAHWGIDPLTNELATDIIRAVCVVICCFGFVDWFLFWKDPELFGYAESTIQSPTDATQDFQTLTAAQRCYVLMLRYFLYSLVFVMSFVALNMT